MSENEMKKAKLGEAVKEVGKSASRLLNNTAKVVVKNIDQNDDGEFNMQDMAIVAEGIGNVAKNTANSIKENIEEKNRQMEKKLLHPIFIEDLESADFSMTKLIRVTEVDKKRAESEVCIGAVGYISDLKEMQVVNLYSDKLDVFGLTFYVCIIIIFIWVMIFSSSASFLNNSVLNSLGRAGQLSISFLFLP